jgi:pimeloyl-ACP methyl ester carboxylesterase
MKRTVVTATLVLICAAGNAGSQTSAQLCTASSCTSFVAIESGKGVLVYRNYELSAGSPAVRQLVFVVHGSGRNAYNVFSNIVTAADSVGKLPETLVVAPLFKTTDDAPGANDLIWTSDAWKSGDESSPPGVSSFEVIDALARSVVEGRRFPNLGLITIVGHSAGGQFTQRYAAGNEIQDAYRNLKFNYVVMNPSSYMYLSPHRPLAGTVDEFGIPAGCAGYHEYKYGVLRRNAYMDRLPVSDLTSRYLRRHVTYLVGSDDTSRTNDLDISCSGDAQGDTRFARGVAYSNYIEQHYPANHHAGGVVPGVGHSSSQMASSVAGKVAIFPDPLAIPATNPYYVRRPLPPTGLRVM